MSGNTWDSLRKNTGLYLCCCHSDYFEAENDDANIALKKCTNDSIFFNIRHPERVKYTLLIKKIRVHVNMKSSMNRE